MKSMKNIQLPYHPVLDDRILVDQHTGQIFMNAPGLELTFPMLVVRHGETDGNVKRALQGQVDTPENRLNEAGKTQARRAARHLYEELTELLGEHVKDFATSGKLIILHSPMSRAQDTANTFIEYFKSQTGIALDAHMEEKLTEICFGALDGLAFDEIKDEELKELVLRYRTHQDATIDWKGTGESFLDVVIRANNLLEKLNTQYYHKDVLVIAFAHGMLINALRTVVSDMALLEEDGMIAFRKHALGNAEFYWLGRSQQIAEQLFDRFTQKSA
jgi:broad specificity phosphatase PhoE